MREMENKPLHVQHVARLAAQLFDQLMELHGLGPRERLLLEAPRTCTTSATNTDWEAKAITRNRLGLSRTALGTLHRPGGRGHRAGGPLSPQGNARNGPRRIPRAR